MITVGNDCRALKEKIHLKVGIPLKPMLAKPTAGIQIVLKRFDKMRFTCEYKYDGFRGQIHYYIPEGKTEAKIEIYSRNLEYMTVAYPDVVNFLRDYI